MDSRLKNISLFDLSILAELSNHSSLRSLGRALDIAPPKLTKTLSQVRREIQIEIIKTSPHGYFLTGEGAYVSQQAREILQKADNLFPRRATYAPPRQIYTVGSRGFLNIFCTSCLLDGLSETDNSSTLRIIDLSPEEMRLIASEGGLDVSIHLEEIQWPHTWSTVEIGKMKWGVYVRSGHPLKSPTTKEQLLKYSFTRSAYWTGRAIANAADSFPVPRNERQFGHEMQTALTAIEIIKKTDNIALIPNLTASAAVQAGHIRVLQIEDLPETANKIYLSVHSEKIPQKLFRSWIKALKAKTAE